MNSKINSFDKDCQAYLHNFMLGKTIIRVVVEGANCFEIQFEDGTLVNIETDRGPYGIYGFLFTT